MIRRWVSGKLQLIPECRGGPHDGESVEGFSGPILRFPVYQPLEHEMLSIGLVTSPPILEVDEYERVSFETFLYRGRK